MDGIRLVRTGPAERASPLQFVLNYEEGAEYCVLHGDTRSETFLSEIVAAAPYEGARHMSMESLYEYGSRAGLWRVLRLFRERGLPLTIFAVAMALERNPEAAAAFVEDGHEVASHGWRWINYHGMPRRGASAHRARRRDHHAPDRHAPPGVVHRAHERKHPPPRGRARRLPL
jgi:peptidoglycan/xylan/chitin deacetylase (PgdA/CDA1 family)